MLKVIGASWSQTRVSSFILIVVASLGIVAIIIGEMQRENEDGNYAASVFLTDSDEFKIKFWGQGNDLNKIPLGIARAYFRSDSQTLGWDILEIESNPKTRDKNQAYAAGLLEGTLSWLKIYWHWKNTIKEKCIGHEHLCENIRNILRNNLETIPLKANKAASYDPYWHQVSLFYTQIDGLYDGWKYGVKRGRQEIAIAKEDFCKWLNMFDELIDIEKSINQGENKLYEDNKIAASYGSFLLKMINNKLYIGHQTGQIYSYMLRVIKRYKLGYRLIDQNHARHVNGEIIEFTSYPGAIHSSDAFYIIKGLHESELVVAGITLFNSSRNITQTAQITEEVPNGAIIMANNRLSNDGQTWSDGISNWRHSQGNKQWIITNSKKLKNKNPKIINLLYSEFSIWLVEEFPEYTYSEDISYKLKKHGFLYMGGLSQYKKNNSKSIPKNEKDIDMIYIKKNYIFHYYLNNLEKKLNDLTSFEELLKFNFKYFSNSTTKFLEEFPRGDIASTDKAKFLGVIDSKIIETSLKENSKFYAYSGPPFHTNANMSMMFPFKSASMNYSHFGYPEMWNFKFNNVLWIWM